MCGRFTQTKSRKEAVEALGGIELPPLFHGRYNIAPTQSVAVIRQEDPSRAEECIWGFKNPRSNGVVINARSETLSERPLFKDLLFTNRCLIPADGFYEWKARQPYYFQTAEKRLFAFAGLWRDGRCVVITRAADANMQGIHDRMPVILPPNRWNDWLLVHPIGKSRLTIVTLDLPPIPEALTARPVSRRVNKVANDDSACLDPGEEQADLSLFPSEE
ncbi:SOS response-associated peptidase [Pontiella sulfatireligans]|uniref:Abasic site processing protein n=1 Tax=Pontiella sulfatireligans TaxID=2750658 RepID=A0A6C2UM49_9BACT|nr:SOS response-associated peptidase [Pontiella sulfatireligans]VGO21350.1 Putative SOS response-associated peptidase YedK [Pontiella sulfatireligans]